MEFLQVGQFLTGMAELILPPTIGVAAALWVFWLLNPAVFSKAAERARLVLGYHHKLRESRELLEGFGLGWAVPLGLLAAFVAAMVVGHGILSAAGDRIPPFVNIDDAFLIPHQIDQDDRLLLVRKYPGADDYAAAYDLAIKAMDLSGAKTGDDDSSVYLYRFMRMAKYLFLVGVVAWIWALFRKGNRRRPSLRFAAVTAACAAFWAICSVGYVQARMGSYRHTWIAVRNTLRVDGYSRPFLKPTPEEKEKIGKEPSNHRWWWISMHRE